MRENKEILLRANGICKKFDNNPVLKNINLNIFKSECHAVVGENGAGKTTLMNILGGIVTLNSGYFEFNNISYSKISPHESINAGISIVHQEFALVPSLNVIDNISLSKLRGVLIKPTIMKKKAIEVLKKLQERENINLYEKVENLSISQKQIVEIAKALVENPKLIILDEPTAALTRLEINNLFRIIKSLKKEGISIIYISHLLEDVLQIADRITVLRDGEKIGTKIRKETDINGIIKMMIGKELSLYEKKKTSIIKKEKIVLRVENLSVPNLINEISFNLKRGEILGIAGLIGSGRSELAQAIIGCYKKSTGRLFLNNKIVKIKSITQSVNLGIQYLPEDRKEQALFRSLSLKHNITISILKTLSKLGILKLKQESIIAKKYQELLNIKASSVDDFISSLSGGNQQKVLLARVLATNANIIIVDEPTQGIDVGAKSEIHKILIKLAKQGVSIILISSELPEIISLSDRVLVMKKGKITGELNKKDVSDEKIISLAITGNNKF